MVAIETITLYVGVGTAVLLAAQGAIALFAVWKDHKRAKRQATLDYLIRDIWPHWRDDLENTQRGTIPVPRTPKHSDTSTDQTALLRNVEHMSAGVNVGVYDLKVLNRASGRFLIRTYKEFASHIEEIQKEDGKESAYTEFQKMISNLCKLRGEPLPTPNKVSANGAAEDARLALPPADA